MKRKAQKTSYRKRGTEERKGRPHVHYSHLSMFLRCPLQYENRYIKKKIKPPGIALRVGTAVHVTVEHSLKQKAITGRAYSPEMSEELAHDAFNNEWNASEVVLTPEEKEIGINNVKGQAADLAGGLAKEHAITFAPIVNPLSVDHVERRLVVELPEYPFDLSMAIDCQEQIKKGRKVVNRIRDLKTTKPGTWNQGIVDKSLQLSIYSFGVHVNDDIPFPIDVTIDALVKTEIPSSELFTSRRELADLDGFFLLLETYHRALKAGIFLPSSDMGWWCSKTWCGYAETCPHWSGRK